MPCTPLLVETWWDLTTEDLKKAVDKHEHVKLSSVFVKSKAAKWIQSFQAYVQKTNEVTRNAACFSSKKTEG